ncbi:tyrosine-type recombinase/integrase [Geobacter anodireducens]|uniref:Site-specific integrase n=1 Tax=Geobacter anodireducens TaxID=1340425 RepID=A0ABR9NY18_9BACT|nr:site-specific integrase [Geobacter anodireducens]MBE2889138.1 site-specific integrase [Geobacter anodireducens]
MAKKGIYKRGNIWWIHYTGLDGRQIKETSRSTKFRDAEALLIQRKHQVQQGQRPEVIRVKDSNFRELAEKYEEFCQHQRGFRNKKSLLKMMREDFGMLPLKFFTLEFVEQYQMKLRSSGLSEGTVNRRIGCLKNMFTKAVDWKLASASMCTEVHKVKMFRETMKRDRFLSRDEIDRLLAACGTDMQQQHLKPIIIFAVHTGCRKEEVLSIKWSQVDLEHGFITLYKTKNTELRKIPINEPLREMLNGLPRKDGVPHVFFNFKTDKRFLDLKRSFRTAADNTGFGNDVVFHTLRHTFASHLVMAGVDIATVSRLMGHKTLAMTMRYSHLAPNHLSKAVDALAGALKMPPTPTSSEGSAEPTKSDSTQSEKEGP